MSDLIDMSKEEIDTPALLISLEILEKNINTVGNYYRQKKGSALLPHQKGHRLPIIGKKQIDAGAIGVSMTSLGLAEYYVNCGFSNILITSEVYGKNKLRRLCSLSKQADVIVGVDNLENIKQLSEIARLNSTKINVAVELYMGAGSCGVIIEEIKGFVKELMKFKGVNFKGLWWHQGGLGHIKKWDDRKKAHFKTLDTVRRLKDEIEDAGIDVEMLSGGFTCTWNITPEYSKLRSVGVQAGSYVFSDWCSHEVKGIEKFDYALTVLTRCISTPKRGEAVFDFGMNSCSDEATDDYHAIVGPKFKELTGIKEIRQREEISLVKYENPNKKIKVGDVFELIPPHSDTTAKLYDKYYCIRKNKVEAIWPNYGRGLF